MSVCPPPLLMEKKPRVSLSAIVMLAGDTSNSGGYGTDEVRITFLTVLTFGLIVRVSV